MTSHEICVSSGNSITKNAIGKLLGNQGFIKGQINTTIYFDL